MKQTAEIRYKNEDRFAGTVGLLYLFLENMANILWVTIKPPKILMDARITAKNPKVDDMPPMLGPAATKAPTIITLEIALVTDIKGECSAGVTFQTT